MQFNWTQADKSVVSREFSIKSNFHGIIMQMRRPDSVTLDDEDLACLFKLPEDDVRKILWRIRIALAFPKSRGG